MPPSYRAGQQFYDAAVDALDRKGQAGDLTLKLDTYLERWVTGIETGAEGRGLGGVDGRPSAPRAVAGSASPGGGGTSGPTRNHSRGPSSWHWRHSASRMPMMSGHRATHSSSPVLRALARDAQRSHAVRSRSS